jgi:hypothetical protein
MPRIKNIFQFYAIADYGNEGLDISYINDHLWSRISEAVERETFYHLRNGYVLTVKNLAMVDPTHNSHLMDAVNTNEKQLVLEVAMRVRHIVGLDLAFSEACLNVVGKLLLEYSDWNKLDRDAQDKILAKLYGYIVETPFREVDKEIPAKPVRIVVNFGRG